MSAGLYTLEAVATFLGKKREEIKRMIEEDALPSVKLPSSQREGHKFSASQLAVWLNKRGATRWSVDEVIAELDRCVPSQADPQIEVTLATVTELRSLCDAATTTLRSGRTCPRVITALLQVAADLGKSEVEARVA